MALAQSPLLDAAAMVNLEPIEMDMLFYMATFIQPGARVCELQAKTRESFMAVVTGCLNMSHVLFSNGV